MKNLRKVLAFILCVAMMASMMISASALAAKDFSDYSEIQNADAVAMLTELGIINGYPTGDFQPEGTVTRAEMAKMIFVVLNAGSDTAPTPDAQRYTDVWDGMWCEGYVAFCDDLGVIAGYGDGSFGPNETVTATQAAKMLLVAMGYDSATEGFTGTNWDYNVLKVASANGLFENFDASVDAGCTRDDAALLIYNALIADEVSYVGSTAIANGNTLLGEYFGIVAVTGVVVANEYANLFDSVGLRSGYTEIALVGDQYVDDDHAIDPGFTFGSQTYDGGANYPQLPFIYDRYDVQTEDTNGAVEEAVYWVRKDAVDDEEEYQTQVFNVSTDLDLVGKTVTLYAKLKDNSSYYYTSVVEAINYDGFSGKVVGNVVADDDCVVKTYDGTSYEEFDYKALKKEGYSFDKNTRYFVNYAMSWNDAMDPGRYWDTQFGHSAAESMFYDGTNAIEYNLPGEYTELIDVDGDGVIEIVLKQRDILAVADYDKYDEVWNFMNTSDNDSDAGTATYVGYAEVDPDYIVTENEEEFADEDVVLVQYVDGIFYVEKADYMEAVPTVVDYANEDYPYVTLNGEKYIESGIYWVNEDMEVWYAEDMEDKALSSDITNMSTTSPDNYRVYFDSMGNIVAYLPQPKGDRPSNYALLTASYVDGYDFQYGLTFQDEEGISLYDVYTNKYQDVQDFDEDFFVTETTSAADLLNINDGYYADGVLYCQSGLVYMDLVNHFAYLKASASTSPYDTYNVNTGVYGYGDETALVNISEKSDGSVSVDSFDAEAVFSDLSVSTTNYQQRAFSKGDGKYLYATDETIFFVYFKNDVTYSGKSYWVTKTYSFTGYEDLGKYTEVKCAYGISTDGTTADAIVLEVGSDSMKPAEDYAYVCGLMSQQGSMYQVLYINGSGEVMTMLADPASDCFAAYLKDADDPTKGVTGITLGLYVIDGDCLNSPLNYVGAAGTFAVAAEEIAAAVNSEYLVNEDAMGYYELTDDTKYYVTVYYETSSNYIYRRVAELDGIDDLLDFYNETLALDGTFSTDFIAFYNQAVNGSYVDNNVTAVIAAARFGGSVDTDKTVAKYGAWASSAEKVTSTAEVVEALGADETVEETTTDDTTTEA